MNRQLQLTLVLLAFLAMASPLMAEVEANEYTLTEAGTIYETDLVGKTAIISGYQYEFSGTNGYDLPKVRMLGSDYGSFELLQTGMKVKVTYRPSPDARIVVVLEQLGDNAEVGEGVLFPPDEGHEP